MTSSIFFGCFFAATLTLAACHEDGVRKVDDGSHDVGKDGERKVDDGSHDVGKDSCPAENPRGGSCNVIDLRCEYESSVCECGLESVWFCYGDFPRTDADGDASPDADPDSTICPEVCITYTSGDAAIEPEPDAGLRDPPTPSCAPIEAECNGDSVCACKLRCPQANCTPGQCAFHCPGI